MDIRSARSSNEYLIPKILPCIRFKEITGKRLCRDYDQQFQGRNRKYYKITQSGKIRQEHLKKEWKEYITIIDDIVNGGMGND